MTTVTGSRPFRIIVAVLVVVVLLAGIVVAITRGGIGGDEGPTRVPYEPDDRTPEERARSHLDTLPDGEHQGRLVTIDPLTVTFRLVRILSGPEAVEAAIADGRIPEGGSLPNDFYIDDTFQTVTLPIAGDAAIVIFDCANGCQEVPTTLQALVAGEVAPQGGAESYFTFRMAGETVVAMSEVYLP